MGVSEGAISFFPLSVLKGSFSTLIGTRNGLERGRDCLTTFQPSKVRVRASECSKQFLWQKRKRRRKMDLRCCGGGVSRIAISHLPQMSAGILHPANHYSSSSSFARLLTLAPAGDHDRHNPVRVIFISLGGELNGKSGEEEGGSVVRGPPSPNHISRIRRKAKTGPLIPPKRTFQKHEVSHCDIHSSSCIGYLLQ